MKTIDQTFDETIGLVKFQIEKKILLNELNHLKHFTHLQNDLITQNLFFKNICILILKRLSLKYNN